MVNLNYILNNLPAYKGIEIINFQNGSNQNIIDTIHKNFKEAVKQTAKIAPSFKGSSVYETGLNIQNFLVKNVKYVNDGNQVQKIKLPSALINTGFGDCKSFALFTAAILYNLNIPVSFRYASYDSIDPTPSHVYNIAYGESGPVIIDAVYQIYGGSFNQEKKYKHKKDFKMRISSISGMLGCPENNISGYSPMIGGDDIGKFGDGVKKATAKVQTAVKKAAPKVQTAVKKAGAGIKYEAKKAGAGIKYEAKKTGGNIKKVAKKVIPVIKTVGIAPAREAFKALVLMNFRGYANLLNSQLSKSLELWKKLGGDRTVLEKAIKTGITKKPLLSGSKQQLKIKEVSRGKYTVQNAGSVSGVMIGEPATVAAILSAAATIIVAFRSILGKAADSTSSDPGAQDEGGGDSGNIIDDVTEIIKSATDIFKPSGGGGSTESPTPENTNTSGSEAAPETGFFPWVKRNPLLSAGLALGLLYGAKKAKIFK